MASPQEILDAIRLGELQRRDPITEFRARRYSVAPVGSVGDEVTFDPSGQKVIARYPVGHYAPSAFAISPPPGANYPALTQADHEYYMSRDNAGTVSPLKRMAMAGRINDPLSMNTALSPDDQRFVDQLNASDLAEAQQPPVAAPNPGREAAMRLFLQSRTPKPDSEVDTFAPPSAGLPPVTMPRFLRTDMATGETIPNRPVLQGMTPEQRARWIENMAETPTVWKTSGQADPNPRIDAMIADTEAKTRARLLAENPSLRGTPFETGGDPRDVLARQMMLTPRERAMEAILNAPGDKAAQLRADPALADRIAMEKALNAKMGVERNPVERDPNASIYANLATATLNAADRRAAREAQGVQPAYRDEARIAEVAAQRQAERAQRQQMVSALARGRQGIFTKEDAMNLMLMRTPGAAEAMIRGQQGMQDNFTRLLAAKMGIDAEMLRSNNYQNFQANRDALNRTHEVGMRQMELDAKSLDEARRLAPDIADTEAQLRMLPSSDPRRPALEEKLRALKSAVPSRFGSPPPAPSSPISTSPPVISGAANDLALAIEGDKTLGEAIARLKGAGDALGDPETQRRIGSRIRAKFSGDIEKARAALGPVTRDTPFGGFSSETRELVKNDPWQTWIGDNIFGWSETPEQFRIRKIIHAMLSPDGRSDVSAAGWGP